MLNMLGDDDFGEFDEFGGPSGDAVEVESLCAFEFLSADGAKVAQRATAALLLGRFETEEDAACPSISVPSSANSSYLVLPSVLFA